MREGQGQRLHLKSKLLVGAAGMAAAAMNAPAFAADATATPANAAPPASPPPPAATAAQPTAPAMTPIDPPKWLPYVDIGGGAGSGFAVGRADAFVPVWQDTDSLLFVRLGANTRTHYSGNFNLGLGYRAEIDSDWILGAFAGFDSTQTDHDHTFNQFSLGAEAMSADWDIRANGYFANSSTRAIGDKFALYVHDTTIGILQAQESAFSGFDGEVGYRVFNTDSTDVRVFAGGYSFHHSDPNRGSFTVGTSYHDVSGPKLRAEVNIFDLDALGQQSRLSVEGEVSHDSVHHTSEFLGATLRIALDDPSGPGAQALDDLDRRMVDPVRRQDNVLTQWKFNKPEPVVIYNSEIRSQPTNTVYYTEQRSGTGAGTYADPTTVQDATSRASKNQFIVLTDKGGSTVDVTGTTLQSGETLAGSGTFSVRGVNSGEVFTHDFAPGSGHVTLTASSGNAITLGSHTALTGFTIEGAFTNAIYGHNVSGVTIGGVTIDGGGTGQNGIVFNQTNTSGTSNISITDTSITGVTNDGIDLSVTSSAGGTSTTNLVGKNVTIDAGNDGVSLDSSSSGGSHATVYVGIHDSSITAGGTGVNVSGTTSGGTLTQTIVVDPTPVSGDSYGIYLYGAVTGGALVQNLTAADSTIHGNVAIYAGAHGGSLTQTADIANVTTAANGSLAIGAYADGGHIVQTVDVTNLVADGAANAGVEISAFGYGGVTIQQTVDMSHVDVEHAVYSGIIIGNSAKYGATVIQAVDISGLTAVDNGKYGVEAISFAGGPATAAPSVAAQYLTITDSNISDNTSGGVLAATYGFENSSSRQDLTIEHSTLDGNGHLGIGAGTAAINGAATQQYINLIYDTVDHNGDGGAYFTADSFGTGFAEQNIYILGGEFNDNGKNGITISAEAKYGGNVEQNVAIYNATATGNTLSGLYLKSNSYGYYSGSVYNYYSHITQNVTAAYDTFSANSGSGVNIYNQAGYGGGVNQLVYLFDDALNSNTGGSGVSEFSLANAYSLSSGVALTRLYADIYVVQSQAYSNSVDGITINGNAEGPTYLIQHVNVIGTYAEGNGRTGFVAIDDAHGIYSLNIQYISLSGSLFDANGLDGAAFLTSQKYGPLSFGAAIQDVTISTSDFSNNARDGLYLDAYAGAFQGRAEQHFSITGSYFDYNGRDGVHIYAEATNGVPVNGYPCTVAQGLGGGCAFVRQSVSIYDSDVSHNTRDGIYVGTHAENYGAIYGASGRPQSPTLELYGVTVNSNGGHGLDVANHISGNSYLYQYSALIDSIFDHNGSDGIYMASYVGGASTMLQRNLLYSYHTGASSSYNAGNGFKSAVEALGGSYAYDVNIVEGADLSHNGGWGFEAVVSYADASSTGKQVNAVYVNTINHNTDGVGLYSIGPGADQISYIGGNEVGNNAVVGVYGEANFGAFQYIGVYTFGNNVHDNGTPYLFNSFGGSTQILN